MTSRTRIRMSTEQMSSYFVFYFHWFSFQTVLSTHLLSLRSEEEAAEEEVQSSSDYVPSESEFRKERLVVSPLFSPLLSFGCYSDSQHIMWSFTQRWQVLEETVAWLIYAFSKFPWRVSLCRGRIYSSSSISLLLSLSAVLTVANGLPWNRSLQHCFYCSCCHYSGSL